MGFFKKLGDLAREGMNQLIGQMEDPKKLNELAITELAAKKKKAEAMLITVMGAIKRGQEQVSRLPAEIGELAARAEAYVKNADDIHAKDTLKQKQDLEWNLANLRTEIATNNQTKESLLRGIKAIDDNISSLKSSGSIAASKQHLEKEDAFNTFARMEEKIEAKEYEVTALKELQDLLEKKDAAGEKPAATFDKHSDPEALEKELQAIKKKFND